MPQIWTDDFESGTGATSQVGVTRNSVTHGNSEGSSDGAGDYSHRFSPGDPTGGHGHAFTGLNNDYWRAEDVDSLPSGSGTQTIE